ncbi:glycoside hydrolase family 2 protein [Pedobacter nyackensis]|nr:glycoside hydrolase family 2 TIM barrel-domain containing protein [Pedobacter nyackensis]
MLSNIYSRGMQLVIVFLLLFMSNANAQSKKFNYDWEFVGREFASEAKIDSFRRLGANWNDQFMTEKTNVGDAAQGLGIPSLKDEMASLKGMKWQSVSLPHIAFPEPLVIIKPKEGIAYYQKQFTISPQLRGKRLSIEFEAAMQVSEVWFNNKYVGRFTGGYLPFEIDITDLAHYGANNKIVLKINNKANPVVPPGKPVEKLDFTYYSGIYRDVWLHVRSPLHITNAISANKVAGGGIFVTYPVVEKAKAVIEVQTHIQNQQQNQSSFTIEHELMDKNGKRVAFVSTPVNKLAGNTDHHYVQRINVANPSLWHPNHPNLYRLRTRVRSQQKVLDEQITRIGIRSFTITKDEGLMINGEPFHIAGTNRHQNYPYIGNALSDGANYRDAWLIKAAGMDAVRTGHYPPDPAFMDAADELGILIVNCIPGWQFLNQHPAFTEHVMQDIRHTIRRDRNHASVLLWEVSINEVYPPAEFRCRQAEVARSEWRGTKNFFTSGDSYFTKACYDVPHDDWNGDSGNRNNTTYPDNAFLIREYGDYEFGGGNSSTRQLRAAGEKGMLQQAWNFQWAHNKNQKYAPRAIGDLTWAFYDGIAGCMVGIEAWGVGDIFRIPKYGYYFFKSQQPVSVNPHLPFASGPVVFLATNWTEQSDPSKLVVYSNCEEVALYLNGKQVATQKPDSGPETGHGSASNKKLYFNGGNANRLLHPPFTFNLGQFKAGTLKAVGLIGGKVVKEHTVSTPGKLANLTLEAGINGMAFKADGDMIFVYARLSDAQQQLLWDCKLPVTLTVNGDAKLLSPAKVNAEAGIASFILKSGKTKGQVVINATTEGLKSKPFVLKIN